MSKKALSRNAMYLNYPKESIHNKGFKKGYIPWNKKYDEGRIIELYHQGNSITEISKILNCCVATVYNMCKKNKVEFKGSTYFNRIKLKGRKNPPMSLDHINKISETKKRLYATGELINYWSGKERCKETKEKISNTMIKQHIIPKNLFKKGFKHKKETIEIIRFHSILRMKDDDFKKNVISSSLKALMKRPTSFEQKISDLCFKYNLPFVYRGNGGFLINFKNPDFVNEKDKVVIEVFYSWFKIRDYGSIENYMRFCREKYESSGWKVIFIDENEILSDNWEELCLNKIRCIK